MRIHRTLSSLVLFSLAIAGCRAFRPIDPHAPSAEAADVAAAADTVAMDTTTRDTVAVPIVLPPTDPRARDVGSVNDRTIAAMLLASNNTDMSYARLVPPRSQREDVRQFAQRMLTDHAGVNALLTEYIARRNVTPEENNASLDLRDESAAKRAVLRDLSGFAFDSAYVSNEISYHRRFLELVDNVMVPRARNDELKALLANIRPAVAAHLAHAEQLWANVMTRK